MKQDQQRLFITLAGAFIAFRILGPLLSGVNNIFEGLGISQSPAAASLDRAKSDPSSFWNAQYWQIISRRTPGGLVKILTNAAAVKLWADLNKAFGYFNDDESAAIAAIKSTIRYQTQLSYFAGWVAKNAGIDLISWLEGGTFPNDRLSASEIDIITQYVKRLPVT